MPQSTLLERNVEHLLSLCGIPYERNRDLHGYETDFYLEHQKKKIVIQCVYREKNSQNIRNFIHIMDSIQRVLGIDSIVLVLVDCDLTEKETGLAKRFSMEIWDEEKLTNLLEVAAEKKADAKNIILNDTGIRVRNAPTMQVEIKRKPEPKIERSSTIRKAAIPAPETKTPPVETGLTMKEAEPVRQPQPPKTDTINAIRHDLGEMMKHGRHGEDALVFTDKFTGHAVHHVLEKDGFVLMCKAGDVQNTQRVLEELGFSNAKTLKKGRFVVGDGVFAHFGRDLDKAAAATDKIFRDALALENYEALVSAQKVVRS
ncbi:MAG: hypothetical protein HYS81_04595 [Candidatus Aenigmatarchaeota archaeon]|nr:MAG: hypothetical protein HYS81_04595 [Candidatus Aenigmarchaeota archaeon]